jgi:putative spermidine/putrescine transport system permease protein
MSLESTTAPAPEVSGAGVGRRLSRFLARHPRVQLSALLASPVSWLVVLYLGSLVSMIAAAFWTLAPFTGEVVKGFSLANFQTLLTAEVYRNVALRSIGIAVAVTVIDLLLAFPIAFFAAKVVRSPRVRYAIVIASTMPLWAGYLVKGYAWRIMLDNNGVLDWLLSPLGVKGPGLGLPATILALAYLWLPYMILPIYSGLERINVSFTDASADLGARAAFTVRTIVLPMLAPAIIAGSIFTFSLSLGDYIMVKIVGGTTQMFANIVYDNIGVAGNLPFAAAAATFPILVVVGYLWAVRKTGALENL